MARGGAAAGTGQAGISGLSAGSAGAWAFWTVGQDVREFRSACLDGHVQPIKSLLLRSAMSGARVATDPAGNSKLAKGGQGRRMRCRDDAVAASILAVAEGRRRAKADARRQPFEYAVL